MKVELLQNFPSECGRIDLLLSGEVDLLNKMVAADTISKGIQSTAAQPFSVANYPRSGLSVISFSCERQTVSSKAVRQAIANCFDRDALVKAYTGNFGLKANGYFGIGQWMYQLAAGTIQPPVVDLPANETDKETAAYEKTVAQWDALSLDKLKDYPLDLDQAAKLLDIYYRRVERDCDMIYLATNFGTVFDPSTTYSTDARASTARAFAIRSSTSSPWTCARRSRATC